jgi:hypothetical protein
MTESFLYLVDLKPLTTIILPLVSWQSQGQACSPPPHLSLVLVLQENYGDEHRHGPPVMSDNVHVNASFNDVTAQYTAREHYEEQNPAHVQNVTLKKAKTWMRSVRMEKKNTSMRHACLFLTMPSLAAYCMRLWFGREGTNITCNSIAGNPLLFQ